MEIKGDDCLALPYAEALEMEYLLLGAEVFLNALSDYLAFVLVSQLCRKYPFPVEEEFLFFSEPDGIIRFYVVQLKEYLVIVMSPVHYESGFPEQGDVTLH